MRVLLAPAGSRGDFQPLLALGVGLKRAGHDVRMVGPPTFASEAADFDIPYQSAGLDIRALLDESTRNGMTPFRATFALLSAGRRLVGEMIDATVDAARWADVVVGGGAQIYAPTAAEAARVPYYFIAYTPQILASEHYAPVTIPIRGLPRFANRWLWRLHFALAWGAFGSIIQRRRKSLGVPPIRNTADYLGPPGRVLLACDPELTPLPPDITLAFAAVGSLELPDERPLSDELRAFLDHGPPPVYLGFGSMPDPRPQETTTMLLDAVARAGCRAILSSGWARLGQEHLPETVHLAGPVSHRLLFSQVAGVVHHGGAGTTAAAARAGRPQLVIPHAFDQLEIAASVRGAGLGPEPIPRKRLTSERLAQGLGLLLSDEAVRRRADELGAQLRQRSAVATLIRILEEEMAKLPVEGVDESTTSNARLAAPIA